MTTTKEEALKQKESETQQQLSDWVRTCGLFNPGDQIKVAITLVSVPTVIMIPDNNGRRVKRYENVTNDLSEEDWNTILECQTTQWCLDLLKLIRKKRNRPFSFSKINNQLGWRSFIYDTPANAACFARFKLSYRFRELREADGSHHTSQIFKVRPLFRKK